MQEGKKTGVFWIAAVLMLGIGALVAWPPSSSQQGTQTSINTILFEKFKDPLVAASMKIVTFDEGQGSLETFEVRKDRETGAWTIPSRDGYPADAVEQMKDAANALLDLKILDTIDAQPSDHEDFGVVKPSLEDLSVGDEGVGRLVTFKDVEQKTLASVIIGNPVKDQQAQLYVRIPNQDPVYVVALDDKPLTTKFQDWIEDDLLKLSSIDIKGMDVKDYNTTVNPLSGQISLARNYDANFSLDGSTWKLDALKEYDAKNPRADPKQVDVAEDQQLNSTKLNEVKNALDDVKIANVVRKPEGMSANLKADKELAADQKAVQSLASHGFYPVQLAAGGETEILSANGEMVVGLNDGVEYVLRFGNISGLSDDEESDESESGEDGEKKSASGGVNRYLLVTARVNEANFPAPDLKQIPQTIEDIEGFGKEQEEEKPVAQDSAPDKETEQPQAADATEKKESKKTTDEKSDAPESTEAEKPEPGDDQPAEEKTDAADDSPAAAEEDDDAATSGETDASGSGQATGSGQGQDPDESEAENEDEQAEPEKATEKPAEAAQQDEPKADAAEPKADAAEPKADAAEPKADAAEPKTDAAEPKADAAEPKSDAAEADDKAQSKAAAAGKSAEQPPAAESEKQEMSDEEKQELLEAEQEKITKENQRKLDERKDKITAAKTKVRELNARFADWYYVIPEDTYSKLTIKRDELFEAKEDGKESGNAATPPGGLPFQLPQ